MGRRLMSAVVASPPQRSGGSSYVNTRQRSRNQQGAIKTSIDETTQSKKAYQENFNNDYPPMMQKRRTVPSDSTVDHEGIILVRRCSDEVVVDNPSLMTATATTGIVNRVRK